MTYSLSPKRSGILLLAAITFSGPPAADIAVAQAVYPRAHHRAVRHAPPRTVHHHRTVVVAPVRPVPAVRPWYWGRVVAGVTIGTIITVAAVNSVPKAPSPELCWNWSDSSKTRGYWNYCVAPKQP
ncbi:MULTISPECIES: hypothetical protein [unclassified Bosea (in: a-proteobacteria)]|uniref:hypothetical protein n=1 Tax=unclassified Bosea (in: a-proteobacteria) TaxID=2653178 RepID=UPI0009551D4E|nr:MULTISPECIES: hypothetical protein [unclassified Bosea (in: a-proteobacteria)]TAJ31928.1 MAG: hypothetical protein EPO59_06535 [Bosea sp. (in: a-proteobacteria)]SIR12015.1 hypothetical protein SAMN05880592_11024 [Bosea sp. TND4EK4]